MSTRRRGEPTESTPAAAPEAAPAAPAEEPDMTPPIGPDEEPFPPAAVHVWQDTHNAPGAIIAAHIDSRTLDLQVELFPGRTLMLYGVHRRQGTGNGWESVTPPPEEPQSEPSA